MTTEPTETNDMEHRRNVLAMGAAIREALETIRHAAAELREGLGVTAAELGQIIDGPGRKSLLTDDVFVVLTPYQQLGDRLDIMLTNVGGYSTMPIPAQLAGDAVDSYIHVQQQARANETMESLSAIVKAKVAADAVVQAKPTTGEAWLTFLHRLFDEAPKLTNASGEPEPGQAPAVELTVVVRGFPQPVNGVLSVAEGELLRLMAPARVGAPAESALIGGRRSAPAVEMIEHFFHVDDLLGVVRMRKIEVAGSSLSLA